MRNSISTVKNPLTVISVFAGLAEIAGTLVLPFVSENNQVVYIWFLMLFPALLVVLFFLTLNFNPKVLYAPSDFSDEKNYMDLFRPTSTSEKFRKLEVEMSEQEEEIPAKPEAGESQTTLTKQAALSAKERMLSYMQRDARSRYILAEELVIDRLASEFHAFPRRDIAFRHRHGSEIFDAVFEDKNGLILVEMKFFSEKGYPQRMRTTFDKLQDAYNSMPEGVRENSRFLLAIAYEMPEKMANRIRHELEGMRSDFSVPIEIRTYDINELIEHA